MRLGDGTDLIPKDTQEIRLGDGTVLFSAMPADEDFEHNDLSNLYGGDLDDYQIQTGTFQEGTYALQAIEPAEAGDYAIVRSGNDSSRYGIRMTWQQYTPDSIGTFSGGPVVAAAVSGWSNLDGYSFFWNPGANNVSLQRVDSGSISTIDSSSSSDGTEGSWEAGQVDFLSDGTIEFTIDGVTVSGTDETYTSILLGFRQTSELYFDDIQFTSI